MCLSQAQYFFQGDRPSDEYLREGRRNLQIQGSQETGDRQGYQHDQFYHQFLTLMKYISLTLEILM